LILSERTFLFWSADLELLLTVSCQSASLPPAVSPPFGTATSSNANSAVFLPPKNPRICSLGALAPWFLPPKNIEPPTDKKRAPKNLLEKEIRKHGASKLP
jgi:hypothetical protein